jgi:hypothetical protein
VWNVNATASGGGVAEMLATLLGYTRGADTSRLVLRRARDASLVLLARPREQARQASYSWAAPDLLRRSVSPVAFVSGDTRWVG